MKKKVKILFVAIASSSHTHSWIEMFREYDDLELSLFGVDGSFCKQYSDYHFKGEKLIRFFHGFIIKTLERFNIKEQRKKRIEHYIFRLIFIFDKKRLHNKIKRINPGVIHTLGFEPSGFKMLEALEKLEVAPSFKWIHTSRGSELSLKGYLPSELLKEVLQQCDLFIADNQIHYEIASEMGLEKEKIAQFGVIPGAGGLNILDIDQTKLKKNSDRERIIIWPKAYECPFSKALPVLEALKICWDEIQPCRVIMTAAVPETKMWFKNLPEKIQNSCEIYDRLDKKDYLCYLQQAKVMLSPSLSDGIPNSLYEAMAYGVVPIVSPISTIHRFCETHQISVLYAENLYPHQIAKALITAISGLDNRDEMVENNLKIAKKLADSRKIQDYMHNLYLK